MIEGTADAEKSLEDIVRSASGGLFNNAAQHFNHSFYWNCLAPNGGGNPTGSLAAAIEEMDALGVRRVREISLSRAIPPLPHPAMAWATSSP